MKKYIILGISMLFILCGCSQNKENVINTFVKKVENTKSYKLIGNMKIYNDEDTFVYDLESYYLKENNYKVVLTNQTNNHKQIILRNSDGVYVITPSLNKSFKFDSVWPDNSSQSYLLNPLKTDVTNDSKAEYQTTDEGYYIKSTVNYPNNNDLKYQKIYFDKDMNIKKIEVYNNLDQIKIEVVLSSIDLNAKLKESDFNLENYVDEQTNNTCKDEECDETTNATDEIIYPLYVPTNTYLTGKDTIESEEISRTILTFTGEKNFVVVEQPTIKETEFEIIPVYGDPLMVSDTMGALGTNSLSWSSSGKDYYIVSNDLTSDEMLSVASSMNNSTSVAITK